MKHILLYGSSIFLGGLVSQLQERDDVSIVHQMPHTGPLNLGGLDAVIVDFNDIGAEDVLSIMRARPDLKIVGINVPGNAFMVLSGQVYLVHTLDDIVGCLVK